MFKVTITRIGHETMSGLVGFCKRREGWANVAKRIAETKTKLILSQAVCQTIRHGSNCIYEVMYSSQDRGLIFTPKMIVSVEPA